MQNSAAISKKKKKTKKRSESAEQKAPRRTAETLHNQNKTHQRLEQRRGLGFNVKPPRYSVCAHLQHGDAAAVMYLLLTPREASCSCEVVWFQAPDDVAPPAGETSTQVATSDGK